MRPNVLLIDNYDSFTYNLSHCLAIAGAKLTVLLNNDAAILQRLHQFDALVISPGPSRPENAGISMEALARFSSRKALLGVCLGMQIINAYFGGRTVRAPFPVHGKTTLCREEKPCEIFSGLGREFTVARYHSLICADIPAELAVTASVGEIPMAFAHTAFPWFGLQFHPESFMTPQGQGMINNFMEIVHAQIA